jgi:hypothetical protein
LGECLSTPYNGAIVTLRTFLLALVGLAGLAPGARATDLDPRDLAAEQALLDATFRIDIQRIDVVFDLFPDESVVQASARLAFRMRPGQTRPVFHLTPAVTGTDVSLRLDGEPLSLASEADVRFVSFEGSTQTALEPQRELSPDGEHLLEAAYSLPFSDAYRRFYVNVNDILGRGNELLFPTLNAPHELARHVLSFRVHGERPYQCLGSGLVTHTATEGLKEWVLDSEREIASYTLMFMLAPAADVVMQERTVAGIAVRVMAFPGSSIEEVFTQLEGWFPLLDSDLGPFPMPRGLSVVLTPRGGGMEFYGATITSLEALRHEVFHMYFGCSTIARTYRDSWWDEAIDMWHELSLSPSYAAIPESYTSNIVSGRSPIAVGFDTRAYDQGAQIIQAVAQDLGGRAATIAYLRTVHQDRLFVPFNTMELVAHLRETTGLDVEERFLRWLYTPASTAAAQATSPHAWLHQVDMTPPDEIRARYEVP